MRTHALRLALLLLCCVCSHSVFAQSQAVIYNNNPYGAITYEITGTSSLSGGLVLIVGYTQVGTAINGSGTFPVSFTATGGTFAPVTLAFNDATGDGVTAFVSGSIQGHPEISVSVASPNGGQWWSSQAGTSTNGISVFYINGASSSTTYKFPWSAKTNMTQPHTIALWVNGGSVFSDTVQAGSNGGTGVAYSGTASYQLFASVGSFQWYIDGAPAGGGGNLAQLTDPSNQTVFEAPLSVSWVTDGQPSPTPAPGTSSGTNPASVPTPTPSGTVVTPAAPPYVAPNQGNQSVVTPSGTMTIVNNSSSTTTGTAGSGLSNQDIYNDVLRANIDAGNNPVYDTTLPVNPSVGLYGDHPNEHTLSDLNEIGASGTNVLSSGSAMVGLGVNTLQNIYQPQIPDHAGTSNLIFDLPWQFLGASSTLHVDASMYLPTIAWCRQVLLMIMVMCFWFFWVKFFVAAFG